MTPNGQSVHSFFSDSPEFLRGYQKGFEDGLKAKRKRSNKEEEAINTILQHLEKIKPYQEQETDGK